MKQRIIFAVMTTAVLVGAFASADTDRASLEQEYQAQGRWTLQSLSAQGFTGEIPAFTTGSGSIRVRNLSDAITGQSTLEIPARKWRRSADFLQMCTNEHAFLVAKRSQKNAYRLKAAIFPLAKNAQLSVAGSETTAPIENALNVAKVVPSLTLSADAASVMSKLNVNALLQNLYQQLASQKEKIQADGTAVLDLTGYDDVACDLAQGTASLSFDLSVSYEEALVNRIPVISSANLQAVYSDVQASWKPQGGLIRNVIIGAATMGLALKEKLNTSPADYGFNHLIGLYSQIFDITNGQMRSLANGDFEQSAFNLDDLSRGTTADTRKIQQSFTIVAD